MKLSQTFKVSLKQDLILSASNATEGGHESLDYIPGSNFLGVVAAKLYSQLSQDDAFTLFHSGCFSFGDSLPLSKQHQPCWPIPLSLHAFKGESVKKTENGYLFLKSDALFDPALAESLNDTRQPKQIRKGYCSADGEYIEPISQIHVKTALDANTNRVAEGQLFSYQSLQAGQVYYFVFQADSDYPALFQQVCEVLSGEFRLGRSRSAQFGKVELEPMFLTSEMPDTGITSAEKASELTLWLLSDLALTDTNGQPTLTPDAAALGLPQGSEWLVEKSYLRSRRFSSFNGYRRSYDPERQVICRGSILRYRLTEPLAEHRLQSLQNIGLYQELGLGRIAVNPRLLTRSVPVFSTQNHQQQSESPIRNSDIRSSTSELLQGQPPLLISSLQRRIKLTANSTNFDQAAKAIFDGLLQDIKNARSWAGLVAGEYLQTAPTRSQWGNIRALANDNRMQPEQLKTQLNIVLEGRSGWELEISPNRTLADSFFDAFESKCNAFAVHEKLLPEVLARIAVMGGSDRWQKALEGRAPEQNQGETA